MSDAEQPEAYEVLRPAEADPENPEGLSLADFEDLQGLELIDVPEGATSTGFVFEREDGSLTGFQVPLSRDAILAKDFERIDDSDAAEVPIDD